METIVFFTNWESVNDMDHNLICAPSDTNVAEEIPVDDKRNFVFVYDRIQSHDLDEVVGFVKEGGVYVIHHTYPEDTIFKKFTEKLKDSIIGQIRSFHGNNKLYGNIPKIDKCKQEHATEVLQEIFEEIKTHFITEIKNSESIQPWKHLSLLGIKILNGSINELNYANEISKIPTKVEGFTLFSEFEKDFKNFCDSNNEKLFGIAKEANAQ